MLTINKIEEPPSAIGHDNHNENCFSCRKLNLPGAIINNWHFCNINKLFYVRCEASKTPLAFYKALFRDTNDRLFASINSFFGYNHRSYTSEDVDKYYIIGLKHMEEIQNWIDQ